MMSHEEWREKASMQGVFASPDALRTTSHRLHPIAKGNIYAFILVCIGLTKHATFELVISLKGMNPAIRRELEARRPF